MKQRLVMCAAFLHRPRAVLVDEPMVGLDPRGARLIKQVFRHMSARGVAILMSTHTLEVAEEMCDSISIIQKGRIIARGTVDDLRLLVAAPVAPARLFYSCFAKTVAQASWMVATFMAPVLLAVGIARCAGPLYYAAGLLSLLPFVVIPVALGSMVTLLLVNVFPARRARDVLMLMGLLFAVSLVMMLRFLRPERLLNIETLPDLTAFFATLQSPVTPLLPSFWAGETVFTALRGGVDWLHAGALSTTALA